jgi:hypothetical protein
LHICAGEWSSRRRRGRARSGRGMMMSRGSWSLPRARLNISRTNTGGGSTARRLSRTAPSQGDIFIILLMPLCVCYFTLLACISFYVLAIVFIVRLSVLIFLVCFLYGKPRAAHCLYPYAATVVVPFQLLASHSLLSDQVYRVKTMI